MASTHVVSSCAWPGAAAQREIRRLAAPLLRRASLTRGFISSVAGTWHSERTAGVIVQALNNFVRH